MFNFLVILFIGFVDYLGIGLVYPIFAVMLFDSADPIIAAGMSPAYRGAMLGILMGLTPLSAFVFAPFLGSFSDSCGRKKTLIFGMAAGCLGYCLAVVGVLTHSLSLLFIFRILVGVTEGSAAVAQAAIADISTESNKARRFSLFSSSVGFGFTIGPFLGGKLAGPEMSFGLLYAAPFLLAGILCLMNLIAVWALFPQSSYHKKRLSFNFSESIKNLHKVFAWKNLVWLFATCFSLSFAWAFFNEFMPVLLHKNFNFTLNEVGNYFAWGGVWYSLSSGLLTAPLIARFSAEKLVLGSMAGCAICMAIFSLIENAQYIWLMLPLLMYFLAMAFPTLASIVSNKTNEENQGEVLGIFHSVQGSAMGISPIFAGSLIGAYPSLTGWGGALIMLVGFFIFWRAYAKKASFALENGK